MSPTMPRTYPRPALLELLPDEGHHVIEASAGTGKTFTIEHLVVERVLAGCDLRKILVVTFTERAAAELRARIRALLTKLVRAARSDEGVSGSRGGERLATPRDGSTWVLDEVAVGRLLNALSALDGSSIATIHSFCQRLLTENAFAHRRLFNQRLVDGSEVFDEVLRAYLRGPLGMNETLAPLLRRSMGAGGFEEDEGLDRLHQQLSAAVTFRGALEPVVDEAQLSRVLAGLPVTLPTVETYLALAGKPKQHKVRRIFELVLPALRDARAADVREEPGRVARLVRLSALSDRDPKDGKDVLWKYVVKTLEDLEQSKSKKAPAGSRELAQVLTELAPLVPPSNGLLVHLCREPLRKLLGERKESQGFYDFDDMLGLVALSLEGEGASDLIASLRQRYEHVLIDEFQDTDPVQWKVFETLFAGEGSPTRLTLIGDPKQAIYGFRSADVTTYLRARERLVEKPLPLTSNFRSSAKMIAAYNQVLAQESPAPFFTADPRIGYPAEAAVKCGDETVRLVDRAGVELRPVKVLRLEVGGAGARFTRPPLHGYLGDEILRLLDSKTGPLLHDKRSPEGRPLQASDVYVLGRSRADTQTVVESLLARGIPAALYKQEGLLSGREAADLSALLGAVLQPHDRQARARAWLTPFFDLTPAQAERALEAADGDPLVAPLLRWAELARKRDLPRLFSALVDETGLTRRAALLPDLEPGVASTLRLIELLAEEGRRRHASLADLFELLQAWRRGTAAPAQQDADCRPAPTDRPAVQVMTMHAAKGLEAAVVFLCGGTTAFMNKSNFWQFHRGDERRGWAGTPTDEVEGLIEVFEQGENERLLYVALTRAKVRLVLPLYQQPPTTADEAPVRLALKGGYELLNERLFALLDQGLDATCFELVDTDDAELPTEPYRGAQGEQHPPLIPSEVEPRLRGAAPTSRAGACPPPHDGHHAMTPPATRAEWVPPPALLTSAAPLEARCHHLASSRRGATTTSFSQLNRPTRHAPAEVDKDESTGETSGAPAQADELPTSATVGTFLHDVLEQLDLEQVARFSSRDAFAADEAVRALVEQAADGAGIDEDHRPHAYRLLWAALRTPISLGAAGVLPGVASVARALCEAEFLLPFPEAGHHLLGKLPVDPERPFEVQRGFIKGFIDLLFEWDGKVYFADWKSSLLRDGSEAGVDAHMEAHYRLQVVVYGVAVLRLLGVTTREAFEARFGGVVYLFLRELEKTPPGQPAQGAWFRRPSWEQAQAWEQELLEHGFGREEGAP